MHRQKGKTVKKQLSCCISGLAILLLAPSADAQDVLTEPPLAPLPEEMTWEEYRDMNRRLSVGLTLSAIPVPGMIHFYAGEPGTGRRLLATGLLGAASIVAGAVLLGDGEFPESDFDLLVLNAGDKDRERRYEKIPVEIDGGTTQYRLRELAREPDFLPGGPLILLGALTLAADFLYDFVHGVRTIEEKRDRVRFKYGKGLQLSLDTRAGAGAGSPAVALKYSF